MSDSRDAWRRSNDARTRERQAGRRWTKQGGQLPGFDPKRRVTRSDLRRLDDGDGPIDLCEALDAVGKNYG